MSFRTSSFCLALVAVGIGTLLANQTQPKQRQPVVKDNPAKVAAPGACLESPKHWSAKPPTKSGTTILMSRYIRFQTPDGPMIPARVFLMESNPAFVEMPPDSPPDVVERIKKMPIRFIGFGWEIEDSPNYQPDLEIAARDVVARRNCTYEISIGDVKFLVQVTE